MQLPLYQYIIWNAVGVFWLSLDLMGENSTETKKLVLGACDLPSQYYSCVVQPNRYVSQYSSVQSDERVTSYEEKWQHCPFDFDYRQRGFPIIYVDPVNN